jgi:alcohol dehydrogenase class IV
VTSNAVITDTIRHIKMVIISHSILPDIAVNDPAVLISMPAAVTASTGMDALTHAIEAYVAKGAHPLTDPTALEAIRIITRWLPPAFHNGQDLKAREMMAHGQFLAGMAFNSAGLGCVHSLAHQPGATHNLAHGVCNAILLPVVEEFNRPGAVPRFAQIAKAMNVDISGMSDEEASLQAIAAIRRLSSQVNIPSGFASFGISEDDIEQWIEPALRDPCTPGNPRTLSPDDVRQLYKSAI